VGNDPVCSAAEYMDVSWVLEKVKGKQIKNISLQDMSQYFPEGRIDISKYLLVNISYQHTPAKSYQKCISFLQLMQCEPRQKFLQGPHKIKMYLPNGSQTCFWVYSLTCLKKQFYNACDRLAFERCTFLVLPQSQTLVRIKCLRSRLFLEKQNRSVNELLYFSPTQAMVSLPNEGRETVRKGNSKTQITLRTKNQMQHFLDQLLTSYIRDLNHHMSHENILSLFKQDLESMTSLLK